MDVTRMLEVDHRKILALLDGIARSTAQDRAGSVAELERLVHAHLQLEEQVVNPVLARAVDEERVSATEHHNHDLRVMLESLRALGPGMPGFGATVEALRTGVEHHAGEQGQILRELRANRGSLQEIAAPFVQVRDRLGLPLDAYVAGPPTSA